MKKLFVIFILTCWIYQIKSQDYADKITHILTETGFENIRISKTGNTYNLSFENNIYRWNVQAMRYVLDTISKVVPAEDSINVVQLRFDIPQINAKVRSGIWKNFSDNKLSLNQIDSSLLVTYRTNEVWQKLKKIKPLNSGTSKFDIVVYPQFYLSNVTFDKIYEIQLNIAPVVEVSFWKGMLLTAQVIFPIVNDYGENGDLIRPGFLVLSQNFKVANSTFAMISLGNFNYDRYGLDFQLRHHFRNERWHIGGSMGLTGSSVYTKSAWKIGKLNTFTWSVSSGYFLPFFSLRFDLSAGQFLKGDYGARFDVTRLFGETAIGFYVSFSTFDKIKDSEPNAGFHFSIPIPPRKRWKHRRVRVIPLRYFDWEYNAASEKVHGRYFETRPNENRLEHYFNPVYFKNELLKNH